tara:strand:- start:368 stop:667 length:300 start_codon:yes stop_codon:yes gene_type:complete
MDLTINYGNVGRTPAIESAVKEQVGTIAHKLRNANKSLFSVFLKTEHPDIGSGKPEYKCTILFQGPQAKEMAVTKKSDDLYGCMRHARSAMEKRLRRAA